MDDFTPNSHRFKEEHKTESKTAPTERKKVEKVVNGNVKVKKKGEISKIKDVFIAEDASNIKDYVLMDILVPAVKKAIKDIVTNGIEMVLYGGRGSGGKRSTADTVSYRDYSTHSNRDGSHALRTNSYNYDDITLDSRGEAEDVLERMDELIEAYGEVRVADMYDLVGVTGSYTDNKYGWTNIRNAEVVRVRDGYKIRLPRALPLKTR